MSINTVAISGNLTRDAELKATQSGLSVLNMGVAVNERRKIKSGDWEDYANFVDCTVFGKRAEAIARYLTKGCKVSIQGRLHYESWQAEDGGRRSKLSVIVDEIEFAGRQQQQQPQPEAYQDDGIPF